LTETLRILGFLHAQNMAEFDKVLQIRGRHRIYFGRSFEEANNSGNSVFPQQIPDSRFWVMTNSPTRQKREILMDVFRVLGYSTAIAREAAERLE
jgi:negative modulator of initiation of replication